jgi:hypothetical protein
MAAELSAQLDPEVGESIIGYALRMAEANFAERTSWLGSVPSFVRQVEESAGQELFGRLPRWIDLPPEIQIKAWTYSTYYLLGTAARFCPRCLEEKIYWRATWEHPLYVVCHNHGCYLHDRCGNCDAVVDWNRPALANCLCGALFAKSFSPATASSAELDLARAIATKLNFSTAGDSENVKHHVTLPEAINHLSLDDLSSLVRILGTYLSGIDKKTTTVSFSDLDEIRKVVRAGAELIAEWPKPFNNYLLQLSGFDYETTSDAMPPEAFLNFTKAIQKAFNTSTLKFVLDAQRQFMIKNWYRVLDERNRWASSNDKEKVEYVSLPAAGRMLGISTQRVKLLVSKGEIKAIPKISAKSRKILHVEKRSLDVVKELFGDRLTLSGTAVLLGISERRTEELVAAGLLQPVKTTKLSRGFREFSKKEVEHLLEQLQCNAGGSPIKKSCA